VLFGKHPMAPRLSPKKTWEGFGGSLLFSVGGGAVALPLLLDTEAWKGALLGLAVMAVATLGDLVESSIKRDLGIKDMGSLLPGHGGVMDRLDSLLLAAPVSYLLLTWLVPV
jgi:phosphatidate cytidylyltransferase